MGNPMAKRLLDAGYFITVYDVVREKVEEIKAIGVKVANSPKTVASSSRVTITMIPDDPVLESVTLAEDGVFEGAKKDSIFIDMSTVSPVASSHVAKGAEEKSIQYLRAPVSGSTALAAAGNLTIFISGPKKPYEECLNIFRTLSQKIFYVGTGDESRYLKLLLNMMVGISSAMTAEALTFGERGGIEWNQMIDIINSSVVASPLIGYKARMLKDRNFAPAFTIDQMTKDFDIALDTGKAMDLPMPVTALARQFFGMMKATGKGNLDFFSLILLMEELAGVQQHKE
jgi:3-hydroxyisobutyrate dehydrogenase-like beta-hydroxyacid dehydrogenase